MSFGCCVRGAQALTSNGPGEVGIYRDDADEVNRKVGWCVVVRHNTTTGRAPQAARLTFFLGIWLFLGLYLWYSTKLLKIVHDGCLM